MNRSRLERISGQSTGGTLQLRTLNVNLVRGHLRRVAQKQPVPDQHRPVPSLPIDRLKPTEFRRPFVGHRNQNDLSLVRRDQQRILIGQQQHLTVPESRLFPISSGAPPTKSAIASRAAVIIASVSALVG